MDIDEIIKLFESVERGETGQLLGFHIHCAIRQATEQDWTTNQSYPSTFSGFLRALKDHEPTPL